MYESSTFGTRVDVPGGMITEIAGRCFFGCRRAAGGRAAVDAGGDPTKSGGSYTTIVPLLREWKAAQSRVDDAPLPGEPVPESIATRMAESGREVWRAALDLANSRLQAEREALEKARTEIERERDEAVALADRMAEKRDSARAEVQRLTIEVAALRADLAAARAGHGVRCGDRAAAGGAGGGRAAAGRAEGARGCPRRVRSAGAGEVLLADRTPARAEGMAGEDPPARHRARERGGGVCLWRVCMPGGGAACLHALRTRANLFYLHAADPLRPIIAMRAAQLRRRRFRFKGMHQDFDVVRRQTHPFPAILGPRP
jgi:hypothetical protein